MLLALIATAMLPKSPAFELSDYKFARIDYSSIAGSKRGVNVIVTFVSVKPGALWRKSINVGQSFGPAKCIACEDFLGLGRNQLFISDECGGIYSYLFDFRSKLRILYKRVDGREEAYPAFDENGRFGIRELWPANQYYETFKKHGAANSENLVSRFVPLGPGLSAKVGMQGMTKEVVLNNNYKPPKDLARRAPSAGSTFWSSFHFDGAPYALATVDTGSGAYILHWILYKEKGNNWDQIWDSKPVTMFEQPSIGAQAKLDKGQLVLYKIEGGHRSVLHVIEGHK